VINLTLGQRLKILRINKGPKITQEEVAQTIGATRATYSNWEIDRALPDAESLVRLADYYHVTLDYLLGRKTPDNPVNTLSERIAQLPEDKRKTIETLLKVYEMENNNENAATSSGK
jgi:transcriptional regulator with XRE-family HTH domain